MYHTKPHINELLFHYFRNKELDEFYASVALKSLAESFIGIFVPIYLFTLGFSIASIAVYYIVYFTTVSLFMPVSMWLNSKIGIKKVMALGIFTLLAYFMLLNGLNGTMSYLPVALTCGISVSLYFSSYHIEFSKFCDRKEEATEISMVKIMTLAATSIGPVIGAFLITGMSFSFLFLIVSVILIFSLFPLFLTKDVVIKSPDFSLRRIIGIDSKGKALAYQASGILNIVSGVFWPLFIFMVLKEIVSLGIIVSLTSILMLVFIFAIGKLADKRKNDVIGAGMLFGSFSWITRLMFLSPLGIFFNNFYSSLSSLTIEIPFSKMIYQKAKKSRDIGDYFLFREFNLCIGRAVILAVIFFTGGMVEVFIASFFITFLFTPLLRE